MAFSNPTDYVGLSDEAMVLISSVENASTQEKEAKNDRGDIIARNIYGAVKNPSSEYRLAAALSKAITLGSVTTVGTDKIVLKSVSIKTSEGKAPEISAGGESIQDEGTVSSTVALGTVAVSVRHKAQILFASFTLAGTGCALNSCEADCTCEISKATKEGDCLAHDVSGAKVIVKATVIQTGATAPTITPATGWDLTAPVSVTSPDGDYETVTFSLTKSYAGTDPV